jgi:hypothetical protein
MTWRLAKSLETLRSQVNEAYPKRSKSSDGSIGDAAHASRSSDHNPWVKDGKTGVVTAIDITHDPNDGFDSYAFAEMLRKNRDPRIKYVISNYRIYAGAGGPSPWTWRKYTGSNPHNHHVHISVDSNKTDYDDTKPWKIDGLDAKHPPEKPYIPPPKTLKKGDKGDLVKVLQEYLCEHGVRVVVDSDFGSDTQKAVKAFQKSVKIMADGIVGPHTWEKLTEPSK